MDPTALHEKIEARRATIGIIGVGYVGLPLALSFVEAGHTVHCYDQDSRKLRLLEDGESYIEHISGRRVTDARRTGRLHPYKGRGMERCDVYIICVPTPLNANREPDLSCVRAAAGLVAEWLHPEALVVLESTTWPGTTREVLVPILENAALLQERLEVLRAGSDFLVAFSPEREDPGNEQFNTRTTCKLVGGLDTQALVTAVALYRTIISEVHPCPSAEVAEMAKLHENIFRSVNIALANELKVLCERMGIDVWEVIEAAKTKPFGFMPFYPGPGLGGHCIPIDPFYLTWRARQFGLSTKFIELAGEINQGMPHYVYERVAHALNAIQMPVRGSNVLVVGVAYKANVGDARETPALPLMDKLHEAGANVLYHDPHVAKLTGREHAWVNSNLGVDMLRTIDCAVIVTDHRGVNYRSIAEHAATVVDTRNALLRHGVSTAHAHVFSA